MVGVNAVKSQCRPKSKTQTISVNTTLSGSARKNTEGNKNKEEYYFKSIAHALGLRITLTALA